MPSFVNLGAYVDTGTMVDTWATVGSCAQIGKNCHHLRRRRHRRRARAAAGRARDHRGQLLHRRALGSRRRRDRARRRGARRWACSSAPRPRSSIARPARFCTAKCRPIRSSCPGTLPGKPRAAPEPLLRGDRQARRRAHALQDQHQRAAEGLRAPGRCPPIPSPSPAICSAVRSVTPAEGGALAFLEKTLKAAGFTVHRMTFSEPGTEDVENFYARIGTTAPHLMFAGHTDVVPPGDETAWQHGAVLRRDRRRRAYGRGAVDMKGGIACCVAAVLDHLAANGGKPKKGSISFLITGDEEGIAVNGTPKLLQLGRPTRGEKFDHCILGEPSNQQELGDTIKIGRRGSLNGQLIVTGKQGHVAYPQRGDNPIRGLVTLIAALQSEPLDARQRQFPAVESGIHLGRRRQQDGQPHSRRSAGALQHPLQRLPHAGLAEGADRAARGEGGRRQDQIMHSSGSRRTPTCSSPSPARSPNWCRMPSPKSPAASRSCRPRGGTSDARFITQLLPGGGIRPGRPDHA